MDKAIKVRKKRYVYNIVREKQLISKLFNGLPDENTCYKCLSEGGFSSIGYIRWVAEHAKINKLYASSLSIGKKHSRSLDNMHKRGLLDKATFMVGTLMQQGSHCREEYSLLNKVCDENGWEIIVTINHSKLLLFDTDIGKFVLETSSNLNENPRVEQFSFVKDEELYSFYQDMFERELERYRKKQK